MEWGWIIGGAALFILLLIAIWVFRMHKTKGSGFFGSPSPSAQCIRSNQTAAFDMKDKTKKSASEARFDGCYRNKPECYEKGGVNVYCINKSGTPGPRFATKRVNDEETVFDLKTAKTRRDQRQAEVDAEKARQAALVGQPTETAYGQPQQQQYGQPQQQYEQQQYGQQYGGGKTDD